MNLKFTYISIALAAALAACSSEDTPPPAPEVTEDNPTYMSFSLTMENPTGVTRATRADVPDLDAPATSWGDIYTESAGTNFDIRLLGDNFTAVIVDETNTKVGAFNILSYWTTATEYTVTYFIHGSFAPDDTQKYPTQESLKNAQGLKLMVVANSPTDPMSCLDANNKFDLANLDFEYVSKSSPLEEGENIEEPGFPAIPMFGVCKADFSKLKQGSFSWINDENNSCQLLRSMAKISVQLKLKPEQKDRVKLVSVSLNKHKAKGLIAPGKWDTANATTAIKFAETLREHSDPVSKGYTSTRVSKVEGEDNITIYLPEMANDATATLPGNPTAEDLESEKSCIQLKVEYTVDNGPVKSNHLYITKYQGGGPVKDANGNYQLGLWDIVRNHIYEFNITGVQDSKISIEANVKDWQYHKTIQPLE